MSPGCRALKAQAFLVGRCACGMAPTLAGLWCGGTEPFQGGGGRGMGWLLAGKQKLSISFFKKKKLSIFF